MNAAIVRLADDGVPLKEIVRRNGHSRNLVRHVIRGERTDVFRVRRSSLEAYLPFLDEQWDAGCRNGAALWRRAKARGFRGSLRVVTEWATRRRRSERASDQRLQKVPSARTVARLMATARDHLSKADSVTIAAIETGVPFFQARILMDRFHSMIRKRPPPISTLGLPKPARASSHPSPTELPATRPPSVLQSRSRGRMDKRKVRSRGSSWSSARCMDAARSTSSRQDSSARHDHRIIGIVNRAGFAGGCFV